MFRAIRISLPSMSRIACRLLWACCLHRSMPYGVTITKGLSGFVFAAAFYSDNNKYNSLFISNYVDVYVSDAVKRVPGVANVHDFRRTRIRHAPLA